MHIFDKNGRYIGIQSSQDQRVCDHCGHRFLSGYFRVSRTYSEEAICDRCVENGKGRRSLPPIRLGG